MNDHRYSACCGARVYDDDDLCSECHEHCTVIVTCPDCDGKGRVDVLDHSRMNSGTISPVYKEEECLTCKGEGEVEE